MRNRPNPFSSFALCSLIAVLSACGGGGGKSSTATATATATPTSASSNTAPSISGQPGSSVKVGQSYSFQPSASDPEGATLQFTVSNLPTWAAFDSRTGRISGSPTSAAVGYYSGISITVSDGAKTAELGPFAISVVDVGMGAVTLSWTPPTANTDGSVLRDLVGYKVLYGRSATELTQTVTINNSSMSTYVIENLNTGTWYFAVVSVNTAGSWSALSNVASKTVS